MSTAMLLGLSLAVFAATAALDFAWVHCVGAVKDDRALASGAWSMAVCAIGLFAGFSVYRWSPWMVIPDVAGAGVGAAVGVWWRRRKRVYL